MNFKKNIIKIFQFFMILEQCKLWRVGILGNGRFSPELHWFCKGKWLILQRDTTDSQLVKVYTSLKPWGIGNFWYYFFWSSSNFIDSKNVFITFWWFFHMCVLEGKTCDCLDFLGFQTAIKVRMMSSSHVSTWASPQTSSALVLKLYNTLEKKITKK